VKRVRRHIRVQAPGKLFVAGEYAVLDGGAAAVAAVDRGVICWVRAGDKVHTPDGDTRFATAALAAVNAPTRQYLFEHWNPVDLPGKPGFGGSAAAVVAACAAGHVAQMTRFEQDRWDSIEATAVAVHRQVQGSGSGLDVVTSCRGGFHRYQNGNAVALTAPDLVAIWSGSSSETGPRVQQYLTWAKAERERFVVDSDAILLGWEQDPVQTLHRARTLLERAMTAAGVPYQTPALDRIAELAADHGGAAKASGAGGGDIAVAVIPNPEARHAFAAACAAEGLSPIPVQVVPGVSLD
jgi:phosphomevalonate kinase